MRNKGQRPHDVSWFHRPGWQMTVAGVALAVLSAAANMASPLYPTYQQVLGISALTMTVLYATFAATAVPSLLLFGPAGDALGRKPVLLASLTCAFGGTAVFAVGGDVSALFLGRVLVGVGLGMGTGAGIAAMVESAPACHPARGSTLATVAFVVGSGAGPLLAGVLAQYLPQPTTLPFGVMLALLGGAGLLALSLRGSMLPARRVWRPTRPTVPRPVRVVFAVAAVGGFLGWAVVGVFLALLPSVAESSTDTPNYALSGAVVGAVLFCSALSQFVAPRLAPRAAQTLGLTGLAIGMTLLVSSYLPLFADGGSLAVLAIAAVVCGCGHGLGYWGAAREIDIRAPHRYRAGVSAALYLGFYAGAGIPALAVGLLSLAGSLQTAIQSVGMVIVLVTVAFLPVPSLIQTPILHRPAGGAHPPVAPSSPASQPGAPPRAGRTEPVPRSMV
ncbi:MFS transporter [Lipingzhangella sp. LS1_29]|uniref:MFS transporter n=1 Tax=Lipingzhangella rawalii TaxID=2055835 RepID=A0ABU2H3A3_9ACTN|nr:MFS transporter [Lipingzhangella rawalii]MDS1269785.1 MFS transporter [Lipingzhangella rawalii]